MQSILPEWCSLQRLPLKQSDFVDSDLLMYFSCLLCSKETISCFHLWNNPFFGHNHCFKSLQFVGGYCTIYPFGDVALYSLQLGVTGADKKPEAVSDEGPPHQRKVHKWEQGTVLLPRVSIPTVAVLSRMGSSTGKTGADLCVPWSDEGWVKPGSEDDDPCHSDKFPSCQSWHSDPGDCWEASCGCL